MLEKDPLSYETITYLWVIGLSTWGGCAGYVQKMKAGNFRFSLSEFVGELCVSGFVGVLTFYLCESGNINPMLSAAFIGISGHMGSRSLVMFERLVQSSFDKYFKRNDNAN
jgi:hypothetical protein